RPGRQPSAGERPEVPDVRAGVRCALVEPHAGDAALDVAVEFRPELDGVAVGRLRDRRNGRGSPETRTRAGSRGYRDSDSFSGAFEVAAVVERARANGRRAG